MISTWHICQDFLRVMCDVYFVLVERASRQIFRVCGETRMTMGTLRLMFPLVALFLGAGGVAAGAATLSLHKLSQVDARAICTDGSPGAYYFARATAEAGPVSNSTFIIHLSGGGWCYDKVSCAKRCPVGSTAPLCSSKEYAATRTLDGIFNADNPMLQSAHKVLVPYCSSDAHMGNNENNPAEGFFFRGAVIVKAVIRDLVNAHGLAAEGTSHTIIWGGASAGARGAMVHLDYVSDMVAVAGGDTRSLSVRGFLDSPLWIDLPSINPLFPGFNVTTAGVFSRVNITHLGTDCESRYSKGDLWKCIFAQYRMPLLTKTPFLVVASQDDSFQNIENIGHAPRTQRELVYAAKFAADTRKILRGMHSKDPTRHAVFSWSCFKHAVSTSYRGFNTLTAVGETMNGALTAFLLANGWRDSAKRSNSGSNKSLSWVDKCSGWECGNGCSAARLPKSSTERDEASHHQSTPVLPRWQHTYNMSRSTILMPCNDSGYFDPEIAGRWGLVDFDWSNAKQLWANAKPMDCQERLLAQVEQVKKVSPSTRTFVYRNLVKALPWYTSVREKLDDPAYSGWFLKYRDGINGTYSSPPCTGTKCSIFYHDQDQTPQHPHGDGSCSDTCDCGKQPCGEYLWDHRNGSSLRNFLIEEFVMGSDGLGHEDISGVFLDDAWTDEPQKREPFWPKEGFCSGDLIGGPTEVYPNCTQDIGLSHKDTIKLKQEWQTTIAKLRLAIVDKGKFNWQMFTESTDLPTDTEKCMSYFADACRLEGGKRYNVPWVYQFSEPKSGPNLPKVTEDLVTFLLARGDFAWIGYGWIGCAPQAEYYRPPALDVDYGIPVGNATCKAVRTKGGGISGQFMREYTKATVSFDCNTMEAEITMK